MKVKLLFLTLACLPWLIHETMMKPSIAPQAVAFTTALIAAAALHLAGETPWAAPTQTAATE